MDFSIIQLDEDVQAFWDEDVIPFYDEHLTDDVLERERREGNGLLPALERALAAKGWHDAADTSKHDAPGLDFLRLSIVRAEEGRRVGPMFPVRGSHDLVVAVIRAFASAELKAEILPTVETGEVVCCLGYTEPDCGSDAAAVKTRAVRDGNEWVLTGQKMFSTGAHLSQYVMMTARTNPDVPKHKGITMFLVPTNSAGLETRGIGTLGGERTNFFFLDGVRVPDTNRLGPVDEGWQVASSALSAEHGMTAADPGLEPTAANGQAMNALGDFAGSWINELRNLHDAAVEWARSTRRADGTRPIDDPLVRVRLAQAALDSEVSTVTPDPYARVITSDLLVRNAADLIDLTGSAGLLRRGQTGSASDGHLEWGHRFAQGTSIYGGTTDIQRNLIAEQILGLPRHRGALRH